MRKSDQMTMRLTLTFFFFDDFFFAIIYCFSKHNPMSVIPFSSSSRIACSISK